MIKAAVLGSPISHSKSPLLHNAAYAKLGIAGEYSSFDVDTKSVLPLLREKHSAGWNGFSLTMPLKDLLINKDNQLTVEAETGLTFTLDSDAASIGSINTLLRTDSGFWALSTDLYGLKRLLTRPLASADSITILGGGGTARALLGAIASQSSAQVEIHLRGGSNSRHAETLNSFFPTMNLSFKEWGTPLTACALLANTSPQGAADAYAPLLPHQKCQTLFEALYNPWPTALATAAIANGLPVISGADLLVEQALDQIALMTDLLFDFDRMRTYLLEQMGHSR